MFTMARHCAEIMAMLGCVLYRSKAKPPVSLSHLLAANKIIIVRNSFEMWTPMLKKDGGELLLFLSPPLLVFVFNPISLDGERGSGELVEML